MGIDDRKWMILQAVIEDYISTAEPVGSRTISKKYVTDVSPATIRNEMSDLEDLGYIEQPHTSSGRVPSDKGYRMYVDRLMEKKKSQPDSNDILLNEFKETLGEIDRLVRHASRLLSNMTSYASFITSPEFKKNRLQKIQLIKVARGMILAVIITDAGIVKNSTLRTFFDLDDDKVEQLTSILNRNLAGKDIEDMANIDFSGFVMNNPVYEELLQQIMPELLHTLIYTDSLEIYSNGAANLLSLPEYADVGKAKSFFNLLEDNDELNKIVNLSGDEVSVKIGTENTMEQLKECSLISATYKLDGRTIGSIGVIGPRRMEYSKVIHIVDRMTKNLTEILSGLLKE